MTIEQALRLARQEGVVHPGNLPFWLQPQQHGGSAVLLVHGFSASPWEMRQLGERLAAAGHLCYGIRLPGHGTTPADLAKRCHREWIETVAAGLRELFRHRATVFAAGQSTGALALLAAAEEITPGGMVLFSPFLRLRHPLSRLSGLLRHLHPYQTIPLAAPLQPFYYARRPLHGIREVRRLADLVAGGLSRQSAPALVIAGGGDRTIALASALTLFRHLGSPRREFHLFGPEVPHVLTTPENPRQERVLTLVGDFLSSLSPPPSGA